MVKKSHFVAQTYLKNFTNAEGRVWMYRKDDPRKLIQQLPKELASHKNYYRQPKPGGGFDHNSLEDLFSQIEAKWPGIVERLARREDVTALLEDLFQFMALHRVRVPAARDACEAMLAELVKSEGRRLDREGKLAPMPDSLAELGDIWEHIQVSIDPHQSILAMVDMLHGIAELLGKIGIGALHNTTDLPFLTSDNPVIWFDPSAPEAEMRPYAVRQNGPIMLLFPVSPRLIIVGTSSSRDQFASTGFGYGELADRDQVERMNAQVCRFAYDAVYASVDTFSDVVERYAGVSPVVRMETIPSDEGELIYSEYVWGPRKRKPKWRPDGDDSKPSP